MGSDKGSIYVPPFFFVLVIVRFTDEVRQEAMQSIAVNCGESREQMEEK